jgi:phospholipase/lecithinase/hemolysin
MDILTIVGALQSAGATHILVPGMPDLSLTPEYHGNLAAQSFNAGLQANLPAGVIYFDTYGLVHTVVANPGAYGFIDVTDPCLVVNTPPTPPTVCSNPTQYLFWDDLHPTTTADRILGAEFYQAVTPEPSTFLMVGTGIAGLVGVLRRKMSA